MDKIIDPFINIQNVEILAADESGLTSGQASQNFFGVLYVGGSNPIVIDGQNGRFTMSDSLGNVNFLMGEPF